jgi:spore coat-associated protein N
MSVKKKLGLGVASAALGLSLVGGGTWAAFNDTAKIYNHFAAGTLNLSVDKAHSSYPINFDLSEMKPGDNVQRMFKLNNAGSLAIKEVLLDTTAANFVNGGLSSTQHQYLSQFVVDFASVDGESTNWEPRNNIVKSGEELTLADLVAGPSAYKSKVNSQFLATDGSDRLNLAPLTTADTSKRGIPAEPADSDNVFIQITFKNDTRKVNGEYIQNKYQGDKVDFFFNLEATQWDGVNVDTSHGNGEINNDVQGSADGANMPSPITEGTGKYDGQATTEANPEN